VEGTVPLLRGALDTLILKALSLQSTHGYGVARWIERVTDDALRIEEGSLYPALFRLEQRGWIASEWGLSDQHRKARFYHLTASGRAQLKREREHFIRFARAMFKALEASAHAV
jgi:PadR family transcriptional regulator